MARTVYYMKKEHVPKFTFMIVFMFFFSQSYMSWVALKRNQYRALSIFINSQEKTWTDLRQILERGQNSSGNATRSRSARPVEQTAPAYLDTIQTRKNESRRTPISAFNLHAKANDTGTERFRNGTPTDDPNNYFRTLIAKGDMKRHENDHRPTFQFEEKRQVSAQDNEIVNIISQSEKVSDSVTMLAPSKQSPEVLFKLKDLEFYEKYNETSGTRRLDVSLHLDKLDTGDDQVQNSASTPTLEKPLGAQNGVLELSMNKPYRNLQQGSADYHHDQMEVMKTAKEGNDGTSPCPLVPPGLVGRLVISDDIPAIDEEVLEIEEGGRWRPKDCAARDKVAIVIPYRHREEHLLKLLSHLHPILHRQNLDYTIYVVELALPTTFNRGLLLNIGFKEASLEDDYGCYIFHDVDLLPEDDRNLYTCPDVNRPRHMSVAVSSFDYKLPYKTIFGGVSALTREQFTTVNGFSNVFFGWGGEDDDLSNRLRYKGYKITRYSSDIARYTMLKHDSESKNPDRIKLLNWSVKRPCAEGLNTLDYRLLRRERRRLYTWLYVQVDETQVKTSA